MEFSTGTIIQTVVIIFAFGGGAAVIKNEIKHLTQEVKRLNGSIKENKQNIHELNCWKTSHIEAFHAKK
jgi:hypothetical protein